MFQRFISISSITLFIALTTGCAADPSWRKPGVSFNDAQNTLSECKYQVGLNKVPKSEQNDLIKECMKSKGFRWQS